MHALAFCLYDRTPLLIVNGGMAQGYTRCIDDEVISCMIASCDYPVAMLQISQHLFTKQIILRGVNIRITTLNDRLGNTAGQH